MIQVSTYFNFPGNCEEAFNFYKSVFGGEFVGDGFLRLGQVPVSEDQPQMPEDVKQQVMHVALPILDGFMLMGSDAPPSMGFKVNFGNNLYINLMPPTRTETRRLFDGLAAGGTVETELKDMFWGDYYGTVTDKFGVLWMFNCPEKI